MAKSDLLNFEEIFRGIPFSCLVLSPDFTLVTATDAYYETTHTRAGDILGRHVFDVFPENPETPDNSAMTLAISLKRVMETKQPHTMPSLRYDIQTADGFVDRWWRISNFPLLDKQGNVLYIINYVEDITNMVSKVADARHADTNWQSA